MPSDHPEPLSGDTDGLSGEEVLDIISTISGSDVYISLIRRYGWSPERYEEWLYQSLVELALSEKYSNE